MTTTLTPLSALQVFHVDELSPHPANRKRFDQGQLAELAQSLQEKGQLTPCLVRPFPGGTAFQLLAGERRWRAARLAGLATLQCIVRDLDDQAALEVLAIENNQREDVHPLEEAELFKALLQFQGNDVASIARKLHRTTSYVYDRLKLLQLVPAARKLFLDGTIQLGHAVLLARLTKEDQKRCLGDVGENKGWGNQGGLLTVEHTLFDPSADDDEDSDAPMKARSVRELQAWIDQHVRFDPASSDLPQLFPETAAALADAEERKLKVVAITHEAFVQPDAREGGAIIGPRSWKRADGQRGSKTCDHAVLGTIAAGPGRGQAFLVCTAKQKCTTHWGAEIKEAKQRAKARELEAPKDATTPTGKAEKSRELTPAEKRAQKAEEKRRAAQERFENAGQQVLEALAPRIKAAALKAESGPVQLLLKDLEPWNGGQDKLAALVKVGKSAEDLLRHACWLALLRHWEEDIYRLEDAAKLCKELGVDLAEILDEVAPVAGEAPAKKGGRK